MKKFYLVLSLLFAVIILAAAWYLVSPLFLNEVVNEERITSPSEKSIGTVNNSSDNAGVLYEGKFVDGDNNHEVSGESLVIDNGGVRYLRFENFTSTNGPDLKVYLSKDLEAKSYLSLGELKGNVGNQNYALSEDVVLDDYPYILIWCERFSVLFGYSKISKSDN